MAVLGGGVFANTSKMPKSVRVSSCEAGPRSVDFGAAIKLWMGVFENGRIRRDLCGRRRESQRESVEEHRQLGRARRAKDRGRDVWMYSVALMACSKLVLGGGMMASKSGIQYFQEIYHF